MSDYPSMATLQNNSQTPGYANALQRARLVAAKLVGGKRPLEEGGSADPIPKKTASIDNSYQQQQQQQAMSGAAAASAAAAAAAAAAARIAGNNAQPPAPPPGPPGMPDQTLNDFIRVPDKMVGLIIGRGGEQITRLQAESGCKIQMAPDSGGQPDRVCTLTGSREAIQRAKELVNQIVNHRGRENASGQFEPQGGGGGGGGSMPPMPRGGGGGGGGLATTEEIMLPGPKVGLIIGKNGKTIKQLQEQSGAKMVVIQDGPNTEYEKPLRISGDPSKVEHAKQLVFELLSDKDMQGGPPRQYDDAYSPQDGNGLANSTEVLVPKIAVGVVIGRGGDMIKKIQAETGCRVQFHQERDDGPGDKRCYLQGKPHQVEQARQMIEDLISSVNRREQEVRGGSGRGRGGSSQRNGDRGDYQQWQDNQEIRVTFTVSNLKCGLIIGRGGEVIKQINAQTGAHCEVDRRATGSDRNNRTFYIRGHPEAVENCKRLIMEKVNMPINFVSEGGPGNGAAGGGAGGGDFYGGGSQPPAWGYNPHWLQPNQQPQQQMPINPSTGQPDYSQQWIDYYRSMGCVQEAEAIEQQAKQQRQQQQQVSKEPESPHGGSSAPAPAAPGGSAAPASAAASGAAPDYSAQWAEYYRNIGKVKEAEAIEAQIKLKQQQAAQPSGGPAPGPSPGAPPGAAAGAGGSYPQYPVYPGAVYPGYAPYPYPAAAQPDQQQ
ncbi:far upstream element-binding protein 3 isoform X2 [Amyelois transitella]|uniref:far upstream element-binding protein 3 isoform X2 n=1 Tax=Amyelois transitella TaxID=680683 RepID=UPI00298F919E|nr:far upstream element-binding protein 3 isoform X2 [Amyelois transitella]